MADTYLLDRGHLVERVCAHGIGHPDRAATLKVGYRWRESHGVHGCDGCCSAPDWPGRWTPRVEDIGAPRG